MQEKEPASKDEGKVLDAIYSTLEGFEAWGEVLPRVAQWLGAESGLLFTPEEGDPARGFGLSYHIPEEALRSYAAYYNTRDVWKDAATQRGITRAGGVFRSEQLIPEPVKQRTEIYADLWRRVDVSHMLCTVLTDERDAEVLPMTALSVFRPARKGAFSDRQAGRSQRLLPHIRRALLASRRLESVKQLLAAYQAGLAAAGDVLLILAPDRRVLHVSAQPEDLFGTRALLRLHQGKLWANDGRLRARLEAAIRDAAAGNPAGAIRFDAGPSLEVEITVLPLRPGQLVARIRAIQRSSIAGVARVGERYGLTEAERRVLTLLAEGNDVAQIAAALSIRPMTVRTHLANLFGKTGVHSQRELVALVWRSA